MDGEWDPWVPAWAYYYCWIQCELENAPFHPDCCYKQWEKRFWQRQVDTIVEFYEYRDELKKRYDI